MKKYLPYLVASLLLAYSIILPIAKSGSWYPMHDSTSPERVVLMQQDMLGGQFPPIWAESINGGYGYPLFHFYAPLFHLTASFLSFVVTPVTTALKLTIFLTLTLGILGVMLFAKRWGRVSALIAGIAFALSPYLAVDTYVRGAFSELLSICLLPWVLIATERLGSVRRVILASLSLSLFVLSHNLIPIIALPMILVWMVYHNRTNIQAVLFSIILSVLMSSWFILPLIFERSFTHADTIARTTDYSLHFVEPKQIWNSVWGYGGSAPGLEDGMSFKLGKLQIILAALGLIFSIYKKNKDTILVGIFLVVSIFIATPYSSWLWQLIPIMQLIQFPWRALSVSIVLLAIIVGYGVSRVRFKLLRINIAIFLAVAFMIWGYKYFVPQTTFTHPLDNSEYSEYDIADISKVVPEYMPRWMGNTPTSSPSSDLSRAYYPTWRAYVDGHEIPIHPDEQGIIAFDSNIDPSTVSIVQSHTLLERIAYVITLLSFVYVIYIWRKNGKV